MGKGVIKNYLRDLAYSPAKASRSNVGYYRGQY